MTALKSYDVVVNGYPTTFQYNDEDAKARGLLGKDTVSVAEAEAKATAEAEAKAAEEAEAAAAKAAADAEAKASAEKQAPAPQNKQARPATDK